MYYNIHLKIRKIRKIGKISVLLSINNNIEDMSCFGRFLICGVNSKNEVLDGNFEKDFIEPEDSVKYTEAPDKGTDEQGTDKQGTDKQGTVEQDASDISLKLEELEVVPPEFPVDKYCKWYGSITNIHNTDKEYYVLNDEKDDIIYFGRFPVEWAIDHAPGTGPNECEMCLNNGMHNDVFLGYCVKCATFNYKGRRGQGFVSPGKENDKFSPDGEFEDYLKDVDLDLIGKDYIWYGFNVEVEYARDYEDSELCI